MHFRAQQLLTDVLGTCRNPTMRSGFWRGFTIGYRVAMFMCNGVWACRDCDAYWADQEDRTCDCETKPIAGLSDAAFAQFAKDIVEE